MVLLFSRLTSANLCLIIELLEVFGHASKQKTNVQKSLITPIGCFDAELALISNVMPCRLKNSHAPNLAFP
jgi:hypothetical protein